MILPAAHPLVFVNAHTSPAALVPYEIRLPDGWAKGSSRSAGPPDFSSVGLPAFWLDDQAKISIITSIDHKGRLLAEVSRISNDLKAPFSPAHVPGYKVFAVLAATSGMQPHNPKARTKWPIYGHIFIFRGHDDAAIAFFCTPSFDLRRLRPVAAGFRFLGRR